jgi:Histidine kinase-, DNA gyrase B-, and HSP90-like ATPase
MASKSTFLTGNSHLLGFTKDVAVFQALRELVENAVDAGAGRVVLRLRQRPDGWEMAVVDDGVGMLANQIPRMVAQVFASTKNSRSGRLGMQAADEASGNLGASSSSSSVTAAGATSGSTVGQYGVGLKALILFVAQERRRLRWEKRERSYYRCGSQQASGKSPAGGSEEEDALFSQCPLIVCSKTTGSVTPACLRVGIDPDLDEPVVIPLFADANDEDARHGGKGGAKREAEGAQADAAASKPLSVEERMEREHALPNLWNSSSSSDSGTTIAITFPGGDSLTETSVRLMMAYIARRCLLLPDHSIELQIEWLQKHDGQDEVEEGPSSDRKWLKDLALVPTSGKGSGGLSNKLKRLAFLNGSSRANNLLRIPAQLPLDWLQALAGWSRVKTTSEKPATSSSSFSSNSRSAATTHSKERLAYNLSLAPSIHLSLFEEELPTGDKVLRLHLFRDSLAGVATLLANNERLLQTTQQEQPLLGTDADTELDNGTEAKVVVAEGEESEQQQDQLRQQQQQQQEQPQEEQPAIGLSIDSVDVNLMHLQALYRLPQCCVAAATAEAAIPLSVEASSSIDGVVIEPPAVVATVYTCLTPLDLPKRSSSAAGGNGRVQLFSEGDDEGQGRDHDELQPEDVVDAATRSANKLGLLHVLRLCGGGSTVGAHGADGEAGPSCRSSYTPLLGDSSLCSISRGIASAYGTLASTSNDDGSSGGGTMEWSEFGLKLKPLKEVCGGGARAGGAAASRARAKPVAKSKQQPALEDAEDEPAVGSKRKRAPAAKGKGKVAASAAAATSSSVARLTTASGSYSFPLLAASKVMTTTEGSSATGGASKKQHHLPARLDKVLRECSAVPFTLEPFVYTPEQTVEEELQEEADGTATSTAGAPSACYRPLDLGVDPAIDAEDCFLVTSAVPDHHSQSGASLTGAGNGSATAAAAAPAVPFKCLRLVVDVSLRPAALAAAVTTKLQGNEEEEEVQASSNPTPRTTISPPCSFAFGNLTKTWVNGEATCSRIQESTEAMLRQLLRACSSSGSSGIVGGAAVGEPCGDLVSEAVSAAGQAAMTQLKQQLTHRITGASILLSVEEQETSMMRCVLLPTIAQELSGIVALARRYGDGAKDDDDVSIEEQLDDDYGGDDSHEHRHNDNDRNLLDEGLFDDVAFGSGAGASKITERGGLDGRPKERVARKGRAEFARKCLSEMHEEENDVSSLAATLQGKLLLVVEEAMRMRRLAASAALDEGDEPSGNVAPARQSSQEDESQPASLLLQEDGEPPEDDGSEAQPLLPLPAALALGRAALPSDDNEEDDAFTSAVGQAKRTQTKAVIDDETSKFRKNMKTGSGALMSLVGPKARRKKLTAGSRHQESEAEAQKETKKKHGKSMPAKAADDDGEEGGDWEEAYDEGGEEEGERDDWAATGTGGVDENEEDREGDEFDDYYPEEEEEEGDAENFPPYQPLPKANHHTNKGKATVKSTRGGVDMLAAASSSIASSASVASSIRGYNAGGFGAGAGNGARHVAGEADGFGSAASSLASHSAASSNRGGRAVRAQPGGKGRGPTALDTRAPAPAGGMASASSFASCSGSFDGREGEGGGCGSAVSGLSSPGPAPPPREPRHHHQPPVALEWGGSYAYSQQQQQLSQQGQQGEQGHYYYRYR